VLQAAAPVRYVAGPAALALMAAVVALFAAVVWAQLRLAAASPSPRWAAAHVHLRNGLYANALFDRLVGHPRPPRAVPLALETTR
jgi:NAD(P)H-quinone oxidoreductase subunit 5